MRENQIQRWNVLLTKGIYVGEINFDNTCFSVAINDGCLPWLRSHQFEFGVEVDPWESIAKEIPFHGRDVALSRAEDRFLRNFVAAKSSEDDPELESCYRRCIIAPWARFEWQSFCHDVLVC